MYPPAACDLFGYGHIRRQTLRLVLQTPGSWDPSPEPSSPRTGLASSAHTKVNEEKSQNHIQLLSVPVLRHEELKQEDGQLVISRGKMPGEIPRWLICH